MDKKMKYELTNESISVNNKQLYRIKALKSFADIEKGDLGGFIEKESNLSHDGECWIYDDSKIYGGSLVYGDARVFGNSYVFDNAKLYGNAYVFDNARVFGDSQVYENSVVFGDAQVYGNALVYGNAQIYGNALIYGNAKVFGRAKIYGGAWPMSPLFLHLSKHPMSFCTYTHIQIGCLVHTIEEWKELEEDIAKKYGYSDTDIIFYREALELAETYIELIKTETKNV